MQRETELTLGDRLRALIDTGPAPAAAPFTSLDPDAYTDAHVHRAEIASMAASPIAALASSELAAAGDFVTLELAGIPVIVARDRDGRAHAMRNV